MGRPLAGDSRLMLMLLDMELVQHGAAALLACARRWASRGRLRDPVTSLESASLVTRGGAGPVDERLVRITEAGRRSLWGDVNPEERWQRRWDGVWRMALFDVPQARNTVRVRMRRQLRTLRFGWLQNSVWLSPDPVGELMQALNREQISAETLVFMEGHPAGGESDAELVAAAWDFEQLGRMHAAHLKLLQAAPNITRIRKPGALAEWLVAEDRAWRAILEADPLLPSALLPRTYVGRAVWESRRATLKAVGRAVAERL